MAALSYAEQVQQAYLAYYGRPADPAGQQYWVNQLTAANGNLNSIINAFGNSAESTALYGGSSTAAQVNAIYQTLFGRAADVTGLNFYVKGIVSGQFTLASVALNIYNGATGTDATELTAKLGYADSFTAALSQSVAGQVAYSGNAAANNARAAVASVVDSTSQATATAALSTTIANIGTGTVAQTFTLTTGVDTLTVGANTVVNGVVDLSNSVNAQNSFNAGDTIKGSNGDTVSLTISNSNGLPFTLAAAQVSGVDNLVVRNVDSNAAASVVTVNGANFQGLKSATSANSTAAGVTFDNLSKGTMANVTGSNVGNTTFKYNGLAKTDAVTLNLSGAQGATATAAANIVLTTGSAAAGADVAPNVLVINGAGNVSISDSSATTVTANLTGTSTIAGLNSPAFKSFDASGSTGNVTIDLSTATLTSTATVKGGAGNDVLKFGSLAAAGTYTIDGGAGTNTLGITDQVISTGTTNLDTNINAALHINTLELDGTAATGDSVAINALTSITDFKVAGAIIGAAGATATATAAATSVAAVSFTGELNNHTFTIAANETGGVGGAGFSSGNINGANGGDAIFVAPQIDNGSNTIALTLGSATKAGITLTGGNGGGAGTGGVAGNGGHGVDLGSFETVNLTALGTSVDTLTGGTGATAGYGLLVGTNATVNLTGSADLSISSIGGQNISFNAANYTGALTAAFAANTGNNSFVGGSGANTITFNGGVTSVDLTNSAAKADVITLISASGTDVTAGKIEMIKGFGVGTTAADKLAFGGATVSADQAAVTASSVTGLSTTMSKGIVSFSGSAATASTTTLAQFVQATEDAINAVNGGVANAGKVAAFTYNGNTYVVEETAGHTGGYVAGADHVVQLTGVTGVTSLSTTTAGAHAVLIG
ncbi:DUF4214 domain-containing protein [Paraburkholderia phytofirmans]|uniref:DUF4214 domain-containing protein n=1 Tax=Paraburkholderia phytofirmans TaxID=261302 RepID=UPI0038B6F241